MAGVLRIRQNRPPSDGTVAGPPALPRRVVPAEGVKLLSINSYVTRRGAGLAAQALPFCYAGRSLPERPRSFNVRLDANL